MNGKTIAETVTVMMMKEVDEYGKSNYSQSPPPLPEAWDRSSNKRRKLSSSVTIRSTWRMKIVQWCYKLVDHHNYRRETVAISMSFLDRYLSVHPANQKIFELAAVTSLYLAIKIHEPVKMNLFQMKSMTRGGFSTKDFEEMELALLGHLEWLTHPPTPQAFVSYFIVLCLRRGPILQNVCDNALYLCDISVFDYELSVNNRASSIALASILLGLEICSLKPQGFIRICRNFDNFDVAWDEVKFCRLKMKQSSPQLFEHLVNKNLTDDPLPSPPVSIPAPSG